MVKIALVDSGIDMGSFRNNISDRIFIGTDKCGNIAVNGDVNDVCGHGSQCASVILKECPDVMFYVVRIFGKELTTSYGTLLYALEYLLDTDVDIVNFSLTPKADNNVYSKIIGITERLHSQGKEIFWAIRNKEKMDESFSHESFWNVGIDDSVEEMYIDNNKHCIYVNSLPYLHYYMNGEYRLFGSSTSYATARAAGIFAAFIESYKADARAKFIDRYSIYREFTPLEFKDESINYDTHLFDKLFGIIKDFFRIEDAAVLMDYSLHSSKIARHSDFCYELLRAVERGTGLSLKPYHSFSKLDFRTVFSLYKKICDVM